MLNPSAIFHNNARRFPDKLALLCGNKQITWQELDQSSTLLAKWLLHQGLVPGDRVVVHWTNDIPAVQIIYSLFKAGLIAVTINTRLKPSEIAYILSHSQAKLCFSENILAGAVEQSGAECPVLSELPSIPDHSFSPFALPKIDPDSPALLIYTSGTTARPKGVVHTHHSLFHIAINIVSCLELAQLEEGKALCVLPLMHMGGFAFLLASIYVGGSVVLLPRFEAGALLDSVEKFRCSVIACMPALWNLILNEQAQNPRRVDSIKSAIAGGDAVSLSLQENFERIFGIALREVYGLTESLPTTINRSSCVRPGSMGVCLDGVEVRIVDANLSDVGVRCEGEILIRSAANCIGYWNDPDATRLAFVDGWLRTGDLAFRDEDGYIWFRGRKKEIIVRGGSNISPQEVEECLCRHPAVQEVGVIGHPHPVLGETVVACVALRKDFSPGPEELRQFAQTLIADYKVPETFIFLPELPKAPTGKVSRRSLKEQLSRSLSAAN